MAFKLEIPVGKGLDKARSLLEKISNKDTKDNSKELKGLTKAVAAGNLLARATQDMFSDIIKLFQPLIRMLGLLVFLGFMPLIDELVKFTKGVGELIAKIAEEGGGPVGIVKGFASFWEEMFLGVAGWKRVLIAIIAAIVLVVAAMFFPLTVTITAIIALFILLWDPLMEGLRMISTVLIDSWNNMKAAFQIVSDYLSNLGTSITTAVLEGLSSISNLGEMIWNFIKNAIKGMFSFGRGGGGGRTPAPVISSGFIGPIQQDFIQRPGQSPISFSPQDTIIGMKDLGSLGTTININNPTIRDDRDIRKMTDAISRELQKRSNRGFSGI